jgi:hypothetical protein
VNREIFAQQSELASRIRAIPKALSEMNRDVAPDAAADKVTR